jgi:hypothetical protein
MGVRNTDLTINRTIGPLVVTIDPAFDVLPELQNKRPVDVAGIAYLMLLTILNKYDSSPFVGCPRIEM